MLSNIVTFYNLAQQAVERTQQSENKVTWAMIRESCSDVVFKLTRMKFEVNKNIHILVSGILYNVPYSINT